MPFLQALAKIGCDMDVSIEHEDEAFGRIEGLRLAAENLKDAGEVAGI